MTIGSTEDEILHEYKVVRTGAVCVHSLILIAMDNAVGGFQQLITIARRRTQSIP